MSILSNWNKHRENRREIHGLYERDGFLGPYIPKIARTFAALLIGAGVAAITAYGLHEGIRELRESSHNVELETGEKCHHAGSNIKHKGSMAVFRDDELLVKDVKISDEESTLDYGGISRKEAAGLVDRCYAVLEGER